jgi:phage replication-related protein YjqB (UPF0714/DUF867 family)
MNAIEIHGRTGKLNAFKYSFVGRASAANLRTELKESGFKGAKLTVEVNRILAGESTLAQIKAAAFTATCLASGLVPVEGKVSANGKKASMTFMAGSNRTPREESATAKENAALKDELADLRAKLAALNPAA